MATQRTDQNLRGIGVVDTRFTSAVALASSGTTLSTQEGGRAGQATMDDTLSDLVLEPSGNVDESWDVELAGGGWPRIGGARVLAKPSTRSASDGNWVGWNTPNASRETWPAFWANLHDQAAVVTLPGTEHVLCATHGGWVRVLEYSATQFSGDEPGWDWDGAERDMPLEISGSAAYIIGNEPALAVTDNGRAVLFTKFSTNVWASEWDPDTDTWSERGRDILTTDFNGAIGGINRFDVAHWDGDMVLVADDGNDFAQYVSNDVGHTFDLVAFNNTAFSAAEGFTGSLGTVALKSGAFLFVYADSTGSGLPYCRRIGSAGADLNDATAVQIDGSVLVDGGGCVAVDADGVVYVWGMTDSTKVTAMWRSTDEGATWTKADADAFNTGDTTRAVKPVAATFSMGSGFVMVQNIDGGTYDEAHNLVKMGGWDSLEWSPGASPPAGAEAKIMERGSWADTGGTSDLLQTYPGSTTHTGVALNGSAGNLTMNAGGYWVFQSDTTNVAWWEYTTTGSGDVMQQATIATNASSTTEPRTAMRCTHGSYAVEARLRTGALVMYDANSGAAAGSAIIDLTEPMVIHLKLASNGSFELRHRRPGQSHWNKLTGFVSPGASTGTKVAIGGITNTGVTAQLSVWNWYRGARSTAHTDSTALIVVNNSRMTGKELTGRAYPFPDRAEDGALYVRGVDGPGKLGETGSISATWEWGWSKAFWDVDPSPETGFRSKDDTTEQILEWDFGHEVMIGLSSVPFVYFGRVNFYEAHLEYWDGATWQQAGMWSAYLQANENWTTSTHTPTNLAWAWTGKTLEVAGGTGQLGVYLKRGQLAGGYVRVGSEGSATPRRKIAWHTEGAVVDEATRKPRFHLEDDLSTGSTSVGRLQAHSGVLLMRNLTVEATKWRIRIPANQKTIEGYYQAGVIALGGVAVPGRQWSRGYARERMPNVVIESDPYGTTWGRQLGRPPRRSTVAWTDPVPVRRVQGEDPAPEWAALKSGDDPAMALGDVPGLLEGVLEECRSGEVPVVLLPALGQATGSSTFRSIHDPDHFLWGRIRSSVRTEHLGGHEARDGSSRAGEVVRVQSVLFEEVI